MLQEHGPQGSFSLGKYEQLNKGNLGFLSPVLSQVDPQEKTILLHEFRNLVSTDEGEKTRRTLYAVFSSGSAQRFKTETDRLRIKPEEIQDLVCLPQIAKLAEILLKKGDKYSFQLGILLPFLKNFQKEKFEKSQKFKKSNSQLTVLTNYRDWHLCYKTEERLANALEDKAAVVVNDFMAFKFEGRMCGLAIENTICESGHTFVKGNYYASTNKESRAALREALCNGRPKIYLKKGEWVILRGVDNIQGLSKDRLLKLATDYVKNPPSKLPNPMGYSSNIYLNKMEESYTT